MSKIMFAIARAEGKLIEVCGRQVLQIPLNDFAYASHLIDDRFTDYAMNQNWYVMIEVGSGNVWIWDGQTLEG